jgi:hypothetical protein
MSQIFRRKTNSRGSSDWGSHSPAIEEWTMVGSETDGTISPRFYYDSVTFLLTGCGIMKEGVPPRLSRGNRTIPSLGH